MNPLLISAALPLAAGASTEERRECQIGNAARRLLVPQLLVEIIVLPFPAIVLVQATVSCHAIWMLKGRFVAPETAPGIPSTA